MPTALLSRSGPVPIRRFSQSNSVGVYGQPDRAHAWAEGPAARDRISHRREDGGTTHAHRLVADRRPDSHGEAAPVLQGAPQEDKPRAGTPFWAYTRPERTRQLNQI